MTDSSDREIAVPATPPTIPVYPWRREEMRKLLAIPTDDFIAAHQSRLHVVDDIDQLYATFAELLFHEIEVNNREGRPTKIILPVGPTGQYPILLDMIVERSLSLQNCHIFFMDEYCYEDGRPLGLDHPAGFHSTMERLLFGPFASKAPKFKIPREQIHFPDPYHPERTQLEIDAVGGIDTCYGGVGIHGHVAFNEPEEGVEHSDTRVLRTNLVTKTINAIRSDCGGFFGDYPEVAVTIGMKQILRCPRIVLFPRNDLLRTDGMPLQYANAVVRLSVAGGLGATPAGDYPVTFCGAREPGNPERTLSVYTTRDAVEMPETIFPPIDR